MNHIVCGKEVEPHSVHFGEWYEVENLSFFVGIIHLVRSSPSVHFSVETSHGHTIDFL